MAIIYQFWFRPIFDEAWITRRIVLEEKIEPTWWDAVIQTATGEPLEPYYDVRSIVKYSRGCEILEAPAPVGTGRQIKLGTHYRDQIIIVRQDVDVVNVINGDSHTDASVASTSEKNRTSSTAHQDYDHSPIQLTANFEAPTTNYPEDLSGDRLLLPRNVVDHTGIDECEAVASESRAIQITDMDTNSVRSFDDLSDDKDINVL